jgi:hypothetical protein
MSINFDQACDMAEYLIANADDQDSRFTYQDALEAVWVDMPFPLPKVDHYEHCASCGEACETVFDHECKDCYPTSQLIAMTVDYVEICIRHGEYVTYGEALDIAYGLTDTPYPNGIRPVFLTEDDPYQR